MKNHNIYLVAYYHIKPKDPSKTKEKGYMTDPSNYDYDEFINITRGLKTRDELNAKVILNLTNQLVHKNSFNDNKDFPSLLAHYQEGYPNYINKIIEVLYASDLETLKNEKEH